MSLTTFTVPCKIKVPEEAAKAEFQEPKPRPQLQFSILSCEGSFRSVLFVLLMDFHGSLIFIGHAMVFPRLNRLEHYNPVKEVDNSAKAA